MKIWVKARTGAKANEVIAPQPRLFESGPASSEATQDAYIVKTKAEPVEGKANEAITILLAEHFGVARSHVRLIRGSTSKQKVFEIR